MTNHIFSFIPFAPSRFNPLSRTSTTRLYVALNVRSTGLHPDNGHDYRCETDGGHST